MSKFLELKNISKTFEENKKLQVIKNLSYNFNKGKPTWLKDSWLINLETMEVNEIKSKETPSARYSASLITTKNSVSILFGGNDGGLRYQSNQEMKNIQRSKNWMVSYVNVRSLHCHLEDVLKDNYLLLSLIHI